MDALEGKVPQPECLSSPSASPLHVAALCVAEDSKSDAHTHTHTHMQLRQSSFSERAGGTVASARYRRSGGRSGNGLGRYRAPYNVLLIPSPPRRAVTGEEGNAASHSAGDALVGSEVGKIEQTGKGHTKAAKRIFHFYYYCTSNGEDGKGCGPGEEGKGSASPPMWMPRRPTDKPPGGITAAGDVDIRKAYDFSKARERPWRYEHSDTDDGTSEDGESSNSSSSSKDKARKEKYSGAVERVVRPSSPSPPPPPLLPSSAYLFPPQRVGAAGVPVAGRQRRPLVSFHKAEAAEEEDEGSANDGGGGGRCRPEEEADMAPPETAAGTHTSPPSANEAAAAAVVVVHGDSAKANGFVGGPEGLKGRAKQPPPLPVPLTGLDLQEKPDGDAYGPVDGGIGDSGSGSTSGQAGMTPTSILVKDSRHTSPCPSPTATGQTPSPPLRPTIIDPYDGTGEDSGVNGEDEDEEEEGRERSGWPAYRPLPPPLTADTTMPFASSNQVNADRGPSPDTEEEEEEELPFGSPSGNESGSDEGGRQGSGRGRRRWDSGSSNGGSVMSRLGPATPTTLQAAEEARTHAFREGTGGRPVTARTAYFSASTSLSMGSAPLSDVLPDTQPHTEGSPPRAGEANASCTSLVSSLSPISPQLSVDAAGESSPERRRYPSVATATTATSLADSVNMSGAVTDKDGAEEEEGRIAVQQQEQQQRRTVDRAVGDDLPLGSTIFATTTVAEGDIQNANPYNGGGDNAERHDHHDSHDNHDHHPSSLPLDCNESPSAIGLLLHSLDSDPTAGNGSSSNNDNTLPTVSLSRSGEGLRALYQALFAKEEGDASDRHLGTAPTAPNSADASASPNLSLIRVATLNDLSSPQNSPDEALTTARPATVLVAPLPHSDKTSQGEGDGAAAESALPMVVGAPPSLVSPLSPHEGTGPGLDSPVTMAAVPAPPPPTESTQNATTDTSTATTPKSSRHHKSESSSPLIGVSHTSKQVATASQAGDTDPSTSAAAAAGGGGTRHCVACAARLAAAAAPTPSPTHSGTQSTGGDVDDGVKVGRARVQQMISVYASFVPSPKKARTTAAAGSPEDSSSSSSPHHHSQQHQRHSQPPSPAHLLRELRPHLPRPGSGRRLVLTHVGDEADKGDGNDPQVGQQPLPFAPTPPQPSNTATTHTTTTTTLSSSSAPSTPYKVRTNYPSSIASSLCAWREGKRGGQPSHPSSHATCSEPQPPGQRLSLPPFPADAHHRTGQSEEDIYVSFCSTPGSLDRIRSSHPSRPPHPPRPTKRSSSGAATITGRRASLPPPPRPAHHRLPAPPPAQRCRRPAAPPSLLPPDYHEVRLRGQAKRMGTVRLSR